MTTRPISPLSARRALTFSWMFVAFVCVPTQAQTAQAQTEVGPALRQGVHFSVGLGSASVSASCANCGEIDFFSDRVSGFSGILQLGGAVTPRFVIAAEFAGWISNDEVLDRRIASLNLVFLGYPSATSGLFFKAAAGGLRAIAENEQAWVQTDAFTSQAGLGYDISLGAAMLTPYVTYIRTFAGQTFVSGFESSEGIYPNALQVGVALTIH